MGKTLTIFTPAYNRAHTICRTYDSLCRQTSHDFQWLIIDDGSVDETRNWVESLGKKISEEGTAYDWMGCPLSTENDSHFIIEAKHQDGNILIEYVYKPNGGLYTGYNVAFSLIETELCVCIDSDDYMPDNAVEIIVNKWKSLSQTKKTEVCGMVGLDYNVEDKMPIGGMFNTKKEIDWVSNLKHRGDTKYVFRTELTRRVSPQVGFRGEKDFNPHYMQMQILDEYPIVILNENLCWVEYQIGADSMSQAIFRQYVRSAKSYAKYRILELKIKHGNGFWNRLRLCSHYISACIFAKDVNWLSNSPYKLLTICAIPIGVLINAYIRFKIRK